MDQNVYEAMLIFDSNRFARDPGKLPKEIEESITSRGGEVLISRLWEDRKLAYPIRGQRKGTYWLIYFRANPDQIKPLNRQCEINEMILNSLNQSGSLYLTHTKLNGYYTIRICIGQPQTTREHIEHAWKMIKETAKKLGT